METSHLRGVRRRVFTLIVLKSPPMLPFLTESVVVSVTSGARLEAWGLPRAGAVLRRAGLDDRPTHVENRTSFLANHLPPASSSASSPSLSSFPLSLFFVDRIDGSDCYVTSPLRSLVLDSSPLSLSPRQVVTLLRGRLIFEIFFTL